MRHFINLARSMCSSLKEHFVRHRQEIALATGGSRRAGGSGQNQQHKRTSVGTAPCYCGVGVRRAWCCITCLRWTRVMLGIEARRAAWAVAM